MIESEILNFALNNGVGVFFGILMYVYATRQLQKNTEALEKLAKAIDSLRLEEEKDRD